MRRLQRRLMLRAAGAPHSEAGFTLIEVIIAMVILVLVFSATAYAISNGAANTVVARQHQTAQGLASQTAEQVRALKSSLVAAGSTSAIRADPQVTTTGGVSYYNNEALNTSTTVDTTVATPLNTYPWPVTTVNKTSYTVKTFISCKFTGFTGTGSGPACNSTTSAGNALVYRLSVVVTWVDAVTKGAKQFVDSSYLYSASPSSSCGQNLPIAAPCQPVQYSSASTGAVNITVVPSDATTGGVRGVGLQSASLAAGDADTALKYERGIDSVNAVAESAGPTWATSSANNSYTPATATTNATEDPDAGSTANPSATLTQPGISQTYASSTGGNALTFTEDAVSGASVSTASSAAAPACSDAGIGGAAVQQSNSLPCTNGSLTLSGAHATVRATDSLSTLTSWPLVDLAPASSTSATWAGRMTTGFNGHCNSPGADGCVSAAAKRSVGTLTMGALPAPLKSVNSRWAAGNYLVQLTGYTDSATAETGVTASSLAGPAASGTLTYWNGNGYSTTTALTGNTTTPLSFTVSSGSTTLTQTGSIVTGSVASTTAVGACATTCTANAAVYGLTITVTTTVTVNGTTVAALTTKAALGGVTTSATYQASPSAA